MVTSSSDAVAATVVLRAAEEEEWVLRRWRRGLSNRGRGDGDGRVGARPASLFGFAAVSVAVSVAASVPSRVVVVRRHRLGDQVRVHIVSLHLLSRCV